MKIVLLLALILVSLATFYGMLGKKVWFWDPEKSLDKHPFLSSQNLYNAMIRHFFGKKGVAIVNSTAILFLWIILICILLHGK